MAAEALNSKILGAWVLESCCASSEHAFLTQLLNLPLRLLTAHEKLLYLSFQTLGGWLTGDKRSSSGGGASRLAGEGGGITAVDRDNGSRRFSGLGKIDKSLGNVFGKDFFPHQIPLHILFQR